METGTAAVVWAHGAACQLCFYHCVKSRCAKGRDCTYAHSPQDLVCANCWSSNPRRETRPDVSEAVLISRNPRAYCWRKYACATCAVAAPPELVQERGLDSEPDTHRGTPDSGRKPGDEDRIRLITWEEEKADLAFTGRGPRHVVWRLPSQKLRSRDRNAASPPFELRNGGGQGVPALGVLKMFLCAVPSGYERGQASFRRAQFFALLVKFCHVYDSGAEVAFPPLANSTLVFPLAARLPSSHTAEPCIVCGGALKALLVGSPSCEISLKFCACYRVAHVAPGLAF